MDRGSYKELVKYIQPETTYVHALLSGSSVSFVKLVPLNYWPLPVFYGPYGVVPNLRGRFLLLSCSAIKLPNYPLVLKSGFFLEITFAQTIYKNSTLCKTLKNLAQLAFLKGKAAILKLEFKLLY